VGGENEGEGTTKRVDQANFAFATLRYTFGGIKTPSRLLGGDIHSKRSQSPAAQFIVEPLQGQVLAKGSND